MALLVKIDNYDISSLVQAAVDEFDPANAFNEPQFAGNSLTDGDLFISMTRKNREWTVPLLLIETSNDNLAATVRTINSHLKQGVTLEYREDGASNSTYFDVESAVLEADYRYQRNRQGVGKFLLKVWTRPLGHTGTSRLVASAVGTQYLRLPVASLSAVGDANAKLRAHLTPLTSAATPALGQTAELFAWGHHRYSAFEPMLSAASFQSVSGATTAADSQAVNPTVFVSPSSSAISGITTFRTSAASALASQSYRLFASFRCLLVASGWGGASSFPLVAKWAMTSYSNHGTSPFTEYHLDTHAGDWTKVRSSGEFGGAVTDGRYTTVDLGSLDIGAMPTYGASGYTDIVVRWAATNVASIVATAPVRLEAAYLMPVGGGVARTIDGVDKANYGVNAIAGAVLDADTDSAQVFHTVETFARDRRVFGEMPNAAPDSGGALVFFWGGVEMGQGILASGPTARRMAVHLYAREQFQFFR